MLENKIELKLEKCILRKWDAKDVVSLANNANNRKIWKNLRDGFPNPYTASDAMDWIEICLKDNKNLLLAIEIEGKAVGGIGVLPKDDIYRINAEIGYWIGEPFWNKGIMTEALKAVVDYSFDNLDITRIYACVFETNHASMKILQKIGFKQEAVFEKSIIKNNKIMNEHIFSIRKS